MSDLSGDLLELKWVIIYHEFYQFPLFALKLITVKVTNS